MLLFRIFLSFLMYGGTDVRVDEISQRRFNQEIGASESEQQVNCSRLRPTLLLLPPPSILVGYESLLHVEISFLSHSVQENSDTNWILVSGNFMHILT